MTSTTLTRLAPRTTAIATVVGLLAAALALLVAPSPHHLGPGRAGDTDLAGRVAEIVGAEDSGYRGLSVALVDRSGTRTADVGDLAGGRMFEIGSVTKVLTGMLLAELVADGTVQADDTLSELLPDVRFADPRVGAVTLAELAAHRSGLPRLGGLGPGAAFTSGWANVRGANPYGEDVDELLRQAADARVGSGRGEVRYSNFGMALLGQALAARAGTSYPELVATRILRPLGMSDTVLAGSPAGSAQGSTASGRPVDAWAGAGYAPAGVGPRSSVADLAKLVAAMLEGSAPGAAAATPRWEAGDGRRIGYAWFTDRSGDREITWHNGGTGGFRSYVGFDRESGEGVVVLGNTTRDVEWIGRRLLGQRAEPSGAGPGWWMVVVTLGLVLSVVVSLPALALSRAQDARWWAAAPDRARVASSVLSTTAVALLAHRVGDWLSVPPVVWASAVGAAVAGLVLLGVRWRELPLLASGRPVLRWSGTAASITVSLLLIVAVLASW